MDGWVGGWVGVKAVLRIAYSNQKQYKPITHKNKKNQNNQSNIIKAIP
jgi:hypothetical protein